jgi:hypothetical protein
MQNLPIEARRMHEEHLFGCMFSEMWNRAASFGGFEGI